MLRLDLVHRTMEARDQDQYYFPRRLPQQSTCATISPARWARDPTRDRPGLARRGIGVGTLISFSTQPGNVALDGTGRNSPYTGSLVKAITTPGEDALSMLTAVRNAVLSATGRETGALENHALLAKYYFNPAPSVVAFGHDTGAGAEVVRVCREVERMASPSLLTIFSSANTRARRQEARASARIADLKAEGDARAQGEAERKRVAALKAEAEVQTKKVGLF